MVLRTLFVFLSLIAVLLGLKLLLSPHQPTDDELIGIVLLAVGLTYFWSRTGFRGLNPK